MPKESKTVEHKAKTTTSESTAFLNALNHEFVDQVQRYHELTNQLLQIEARVELAEKQLCLTRDHLAMVVAKTEGAMPHDWESTLKQVRFVGLRLADACVTLLRERGKLTAEQFLDELNAGMFRFTSNTPFREIHAALLKQRNVKRTKEGWAWTAPKEDPTGLELMKRIAPVVPSKETA
jgi:hypothetical protein